MNKTVIRRLDLVATGQVRRPLGNSRAGSGPQQRSKSRPHTGDIVTGQVATRRGVDRPQEIRDVVRGAEGGVDIAVVGGVGRSDERVRGIVEGKDKDAAPLARYRENGSHVTGQTISRDGDMDALGGGDSRWRRRVFEVKDVISPHARGIHDRSRRNLKVRVVDVVNTADANDEPLNIACQPGDRGVVQAHSAMFVGGASKGQCHSRIVATSVVVQEARHQFVRTQGGDMTECLLAGDLAIATTDPPPAREVVQAQRRGICLGHRL